MGEEDVSEFDIVERIRRALDDPSGVDLLVLLEDAKSEIVTQRAGRAVAEAYRDEALALLREARPAVEGEALTMEAIGRHRVMPYGGEAEAEVFRAADRTFLLLERIDALLGIPAPGEPGPAGEGRP